MPRFALAVTVGAAVLGALAAGFALSAAQDSPAPEIAARAYAPELAADSASQPVTATPSPTGTSTATATTTPTSASPTPTSTSTPTVTPSPGGCSATPQTLTQTATLTVSQGEQEAQVVAELALTALQRQKGLMGRTELTDEQGMLFVFPGPSLGGFWMLNTPLPLDIAYLDAQGEVLAIRHGVPCSTTLLTPGQSYRYVLEVAGGWFERKGMGVGAVVSIPDDLPPAQ